MKQPRQSGVELLRIVAMLGIVLSHWGGHGTWELTPDNAYLGNKVFLQLTQFFGEVGNCIFFLITGYFCYTKENVNIKGVRRLVVNTKFYALVGWLLLIVLGFCNFSTRGLVRSLLPIIYGAYWFVLPFIVVCLLSPWINNIIRDSDKTVLRCYFGLMFLIEMILPMVKAPTVSSNVGLFVLVYSIGAIIRKEKGLFDILHKNRYNLLLLSYGIGILYIISTDFIAEAYSINPEISKVLIGRFSFLPTLSALSLFAIFNHFDIQSKSLNNIAYSTLSIYLISEHPYVYNWFWKDCFDNMTYFNDWYMIPMALMQCIIVMLVCIIIDLSYRKLSESLMYK